MYKEIKSENFKLFNKKDCKNFIVQFQISLILLKKKGRKIVLL